MTNNVMSNIAHNAIVVIHWNRRQRDQPHTSPVSLHYSRKHSRATSPKS